MFFQMVTRSSYICCMIFVGEGFIPTAHLKILMAILAQNELLALPKLLPNLPLYCSPCPVTTGKGAGG